MKTLGGQNVMADQLDQRHERGGTGPHPIG
jgi:hypothetical protein